MSKLKRLMGTCLLMAAMAVVVWADGGETQGPSLTTSLPPLPECTTDCPSPETTVPVSDTSVNSADVVIDLATWLVASIL